MVARSLDPPDEMEERSWWGSLRACTTTDNSLLGVDVDWLSPGRAKIQVSEILKLFSPSRNKLPNGPVTATFASARAMDSTLSAIASAACLAARLSADAAWSVLATDCFEWLSVASGRLGVELDFLLVRTLVFGSALHLPATGRVSRYRRYGHGRFFLRGNYLSPRSRFSR